MQTVAVGRDGHQILHLLLQKRLSDEQHDNAEDQEDDAEDRRGQAAVPRVLAVAASLRGFRVGCRLVGVKSHIDKKCGYGVTKFRFSNLPSA